jgi:hypothetical protein
VPSQFQFPPLLEVVKQFAIKNNGDVSKLVEDRLLAVGQTHNAEPPGAQGEPRSVKVTLLIRPAMHDRTRHSSDNFVGYGSPISEMKKACDAAHCSESVIRNSLLDERFFP